MPDLAANERFGTSELADLVGTIRTMRPARDDAERIERLRHFEELKSAIAAAQLAEATAFDSSQRAEQAVAGEPPERQGRGIAAQVALALRVSPWQAARWLGWAKILTSELPATFAELRAGRTSERRVLLVAQETMWLSREDRAEVDRQMAPRLEDLGDRRVENEARAHAYRLDPQGAVDRRRVAERERRVTLRPRPDTMSSLNATQSVERGVAIIAALGREADSIIGVGDPDGRTRSQLMSDLLYERVTGASVATGPAVEVELIVPIDSLDAGDEPGLLVAAGLAPVSVSAPLARDLIANAPAVALRRLFATQDGHRLIAMESQARCFPPGLRDFLRYRDQYCSTPYCGAPIRHADHARPADQGGATDDANGNGKCAACNYAKQAPGWRQTPSEGGYATLSTPTGHVYDVAPPHPPGRASPGDRPDERRHSAA